MAAPSHSHFKQLAGLFERGVDVPEGVERDTFITGACGGDAALERELRRLLKSDADVRRRAGSARLPVFGVYHARELIGAGGMGVVYRATREDGEVRQQVAVKVVGGVLWPAEIEERFRRERQILAELQHPNIARFLDSGVTTDGAPYLVMEFVEGVRVDEWCERARVGMADRLPLFLKICAAVSFAHQKLVVHRDLKPSNILVGADGEPKLLDFGVASTLDADAGTAQTLQLFTPLYASPEVLRGEAAGVGCDVYSLGVLLFELLTGTRPFGGPTSSPAQVIEQVLGGEAPLLSAAAKDARLRGDLDAIVAKALARPVTQRYASVEQFAADVKRYLDGFPVQAAPTGAAYRARKFVRRHRTGVLATVAVVATMVAGLAITLEQRAAAERRFQVARELADYLVFDVQSALEKLPASTQVRAEIINRALAYLDRLAAEKTRDDGLRTEVGRGYFVLADVLGAPWRPNLGQTAKAREIYRKAIAELGAVAVRDPNNRLAHLYLTRATCMLGRSLEFGGPSVEGHKLLDLAAREAKQLSRRWPSDYETRQNSALIWYQQARSIGTGSGFFVTSQNAGPAAEAAEYSASEGEAALRIKPGDMEAIRLLANCHSFQGYMANTKSVSEATPFFRQGLAVLEQMNAVDRESAIGRQTRGNALLALGSNLGRVGQYAEAIAMTEEACRIRRRLLEDDPKDNGALLNLPATYNSLADIQEQAGESVAALANYVEAEKDWQQVLVRIPNNRNARLALADVQAKASRICAKLGRGAESERLAREALAFYEDTVQRPEASHVELTLAAQALMESPVSLRNPKLALEYMKRAAEKALVVVGPAETPERKQILEGLKKYRGSGR